MSLCLVKGRLEWRHGAGVLAILLLCAVWGRARADLRVFADPDWYWKGAEEKPPPEDYWSGEVQMGLLVLTGNTQQTTMTGTVDMRHELPKWRHTMYLESDFTQQNQTTTAERYRAATQLDYKISRTNYTFTRLDYDHDRFSGYQYRASVAVGYGWRLWQQGEDFWDVSFGPGYRYSRLEAPDYRGDLVQESPIGRFALRLQYHISPHAQFKEEMNTQISARTGEAVSQITTSLQANLEGNFALKVSYKVENDSQTPPGVKNTDTRTSFTLLYGF